MIRKFYYLLEIMVFLFVTGCSLWENHKPATQEAVSHSPLTRTSLPSSLSSNPVDLYCENYVKTRWGKADTEWGFPDGLNGSIRTRLLPLRFDSDNRLYFFDFANKRLLVYEKDYVPKPISLQPILFWQDQPNSFLFSITIHEDKIFVPFYHNRLGILSMDGKVLGIIELPFSYDTFLPAESIIEVDPRGRLCTFKGTYDTEWENGKWEKIAGGCMDTYFWGDYSVTGNKNLEVSNEVLEIREISGENLSLIDTGFPKSNYPFSSLFGVDKNGNAYLTLSSTPPTWTYVKFNLQTYQTELAQMHLDPGYTIAVPSVSPDGILYILSYSDQDLSVQPGIYKCEFPNR